jgi:hypothetical protein
MAIVVVDMMGFTDGDGGSTSAVTSSCHRGVGNRGSVAFAHGETKRRKKQIEKGKTGSTDGCGLVGLGFNESRRQSTINYVRKKMKLERESKCMRN